MSTVTETRELNLALKSILEENDRIAANFKIEGKNVSVTDEEAKTFRSNVAKAKEIKALISGVQLTNEMKAFLEDPEKSSAALRQAAQLGGQGALPLEGKSIAQMFTESPEFKELIARGGATMDRPFEIEGVDLTGYGQKDVYTGLASASRTVTFGTTQRDPMVPLRQRTSRVRDLFPVAGTSANLIDYFRVTGLTNNARPVRERAAANGIDAGNAVFGLKPQSALTFEIAQAPVRTIAHFEVAHRNVLADEPQLQATINNELLYGLRLVEDDQILNGSGTGEDLLGIMNTPGIQLYTQANTAGVPDETKPDAVRRAMTKAILAYFDPTGTVINPYDWEDIELEKDANGRYIVSANVQVGATQTLWRSPVVDTPAMAQGKFLTGAFGLGAQLYDRMVATIRIAEQHADFFIRNAIAILAEERLALAVKRPESFVNGTFIG